MRCKSQGSAVFIAIHPTTYRSGGFLAHGVLKGQIIPHTLERIERIIVIGILLNKVYVTRIHIDTENITRHRPGSATVYIVLIVAIHI